MKLTPKGDELHARFMGLADNDHEGMEALCSDAIEEVERLELRNAAAQSSVAALMLEYCPDEMTPEQVAEWERHQIAEPAAEGEGRVEP